MNFQQTDIDFEKIDWLQFEKLRYDLLTMYQFYGLICQQGSADNGRNIEAIYRVINHCIGAYPEK